jgi:hypothetical protein
MIRNMPDSSHSWYNIDDDIRELKNEYPDFHIPIS